MMRATAVVAVTGLVVSACGGGADSASQSTSGGSGATDAPILVYAPVGQSGAYAPASGPLISGLEAAVAEINSKGGLLGRKVELQVDNTQSDSTKAVGLLRTRLAEERKPDVVFAGASSVEGLPMLPLLTSAQILSVAPASSADFGDPAKNPYNFSVASTESSAAEFIAKEVVAKGYRSAAFLSADTPSATGFTEAYRAELTKQGITDVGYEKYAPDAVDMTGQLDRLKAANPDVLIIAGVGTTQYVLKSRLKVGMENVPVIGDSTAQVVDVSSSLSDAEKQGYEGMTYKANIPGQGGKGKQTLQKHLADQGFVYSGALGTPGLSYDAILAWANGVEAAGTLGTIEVAAALAGNPAQKFDYALFTTDGTGWSSTSHFTKSDEVFQFVNSVPLVNGQYVVQ